MSCLTRMLHGPIYEGKHAETRSLVDNNNHGKAKTKNKELAMRQTTYNF